jgi:hypothetical protein
VRLALKDEITGAEVGAKRVLAGACPREVRRAAEDAYLDELAVRYRR